MPRDERINEKSLNMMKFNFSAEIHWRKKKKLENSMFPPIHVVYKS